MNRAPVIRSRPQGARIHAYGVLGFRRAFAEFLALHTIIMAAFLLLASRVPISWFSSIAGIVAGLIVAVPILSGLLSGTAGAAVANAIRFQPFDPVVRLNRGEWRRLERGDVLVRILPAKDHQLAVFSAGRLEASGDSLVARVRDIAALKRGSYVPAIARFSDPPVLDDLASLTLDRVDLDGIADCRPGDCGIKLGIDEIEGLQRVIADSGENSDTAVNNEFRRIVLDRVRIYMAQGHSGIPEYRDKEDPVDPASIFSALLRSSRYLQVRAPDVARYLQQYPALQMAGVETFLYWSKETFGRKPVISVTHVSIVRGDGRATFPDVLIVSKQVFATHYFNGALGLTILVSGEDSSSSSYLVYINRSWLDVLGGFLAGLRRAIVEGRVANEAERLFEIQRRRLERTKALQ